MQFTLTLTELIFQQVIEHLVAQGPNEAAGYLFVRVSRTPDETRLIGREYWPISNDELNERSPVALSIKSTSYTRALRHAHETRQAFWLVHSHPQGFESFSTADDETEAKLFPCAYVRIRPDVGPHGSLVFPTNGNPFGRVWLEDGSKQNLQRIRIIGRRFRFFSETKGDNSIPSFYDRQVRAFGPDVQKLLRDLHIGVVGCGGTGSAVCEQLIRLGIGRLTVFDGKTFAKSNVNRMYGSRVTDEGVPKVQLMERLAKDIGVGTEIQGYSEVVHHQSAAEKLREAEILFGCTDDELGRSILNQVSLRYAIPLFDMGVKIGSENGAIQWVIGRVTVVQPGNACLLCRGRITAKRIAAEALHLVDPKAAEGLRGEGYAPELEGDAPAVVTFTSSTAATAVAEMLHRLTGFMGVDRTVTEVLHFFDDDRIGKNSTPPSTDCICSSPQVICGGDTNPFLGLMWTM